MLGKKVALKLNGQNVRLDAWFKYDKWRNNDSYAEFAGQVKRIYILLDLAQALVRDKMYLCIWSADIVQWSSMVRTMTSHSDPCFLPTVKRLLFVKEL